MTFKMLSEIKFENFNFITNFFCRYNGNKIKIFHSLNYLIHRITPLNWDDYFIFLSAFNLDGFLELWIIPRIIISVAVILYIMSHERQRARRYIFVFVGSSSHSLNEK